MAVARVNYTTDTSSYAASKTISIPWTTASGHVLVILATAYTGTANLSVTTDSAGNSWNAVYGTGTQTFILYSVLTAGSASHSITLSVPVDLIDYYVVELSGVATVSPVDVNAQMASTYSSAWDTGAVTVTAGAALLGVVLRKSETTTPIAPWSAVTTNTYSSLAQVMGATGGSQGFSGTFSGAGAHCAAFASFKAAAGGGATFQAAWARGANQLIGSVQ